MITLPALQITAPSDFKIKITSATDDQGNQIDVEHTWLGFTFFVDGDSYEVVYDPAGTETKNAVFEDGYLYLIFQGYPFKYGRMSYVQHERFADTMYTDGDADYYSKKTDTNLYFVK